MHTICITIQLINYCHAFRLINFIQTKIGIFFYMGTFFLFSFLKKKLISVIIEELNNNGLFL